ncbi:CHAP domain-containing protein [Pseudarthrobacter sp. H2]|uniref:CHAP domain-containing protein n=1 Tax=Pseudarthrobacter sp. H2 TaxID=3418415 RepID=UPI003CF1173D
MAKTFEQFKNDTLGGRFGNPGTDNTNLGAPAYAGQCVSYVRLYMEEVLGIPTAVWGNAVDYWTNATVLQRFDRVSNPQDGDIVVWGDDAGNWTGPEGHIAIWYKGRLLNQNYGGSLKVTISSMFTPGLLGYLRIKGGEDVITDADNEYGRWQKLAQQIRGRAQGFSREEFRAAAVGRTWLRAMEILSDNEESNQNYQDAQLGKLARTDNWQGQIYGLQDQLKAEQNKSVGLVNSVTDLTTKLGDANEQLGAVRAQPATASGTGIDQATKDTINQTNDSVSWIRGLFTAIVEAISKFKK